MSDIHETKAKTTKLTSPLTIYDSILQRAVPKNSMVLSIRPFRALFGRVLAINRNISVEYLTESLQHRAIFMAQNPDEPKCCGLWPEHWFNMGKYIRDLNSTDFFHKMVVIPWIGSLNKIVDKKQLEHKNAYKDHGGKMDDYLIDIHYQLQGEKLSVFLLTKNLSTHSTSEAFV